MTYSDIPRVLAMAIVWLLMLLWQLNAYRSNCGVALALLVLLTLVLFASVSEVALFRRRIFVDECLEPAGALVRLSQRRYLMLGLELLKCVALAVLIMVDVLTYNASHWSVLFGDILLLGLLLPRFYWALDGQMRDEYRFTTARRWALWVSTLLLWVQSMMVLLFPVGQDFGGLRWQEAITYGATAPSVHCELLGSAAALVGAMDALGQWAVQNLARSLADLPQALMASIILLVSVSLSFALAYAYSAALIGAVSRPWTMWRSTLRLAD